MGAGNLPDDSMRPQHSQHAAYRCGTPALFNGRGGRCIVERCLQVPIPKPLDLEVSSAHCSQQFFVLGPRTQCSRYTALPLPPPLDGLSQLLDSAAAIDAGQSINGSVVGLARDFYPPVYSSDSLACDSPALGTIRVPFFGPVFLVAFHIVDGCFCRPQYIAERRVSFVVVLDRVAVQCVLYSLPFGILLQLDLHRPVEVGRNLAGLVDAPVEIAQYVLTRKTG